MNDEGKVYLSSAARYSHILNSIANSVKCVIPFQDDGYLKNLCDNFIKVKTERETISKSLIYLLGTLFLITNKSDFEIPILKIKITELPNVTQIVLILASLAVVLAILKFKDAMMYDEFIDLVLRKKYGGNRRERDVIKAAYTNESLSFKIYNYPYFYGDYELFSQGNLGKLFNALIALLLLILFVVLMIGPIFVSFLHFLLSHTL